MIIKMVNEFKLAVFHLRAQTRCKSEHTHGFTAGQQNCVGHRAAGPSRAVGRGPLGRGPDFSKTRLNIPSSKINAGQRAFYYRGVKVWNNLSKDLREITNTKVFKRRLINELIGNMNDL